MNPVHPSEIVPFDMYFATVVGMQGHPGFQREGARRLTMDQCAGVALAMLEVRRTLIPTEQDNE